MVWQIKRSNQKIKQFQIIYFTLLPVGMDHSVLIAVWNLLQFGKFNGQFFGISKHEKQLLPLT